VNGRLYLVGPGRLGCSLGVAIGAARAPDLRLVGVAYTSDAGAERARRWLPDVPAEPIAQPSSLGDADVVVLAVRDDVIESAAAALASVLRPGQVLLHTSGLAEAAALGAMGRGVEGGSMHPLQTFVDPAAGAERFRGAFVAVEGSAAARRAATDIAEALGARPVALRAGGKAAYHAAAVVASNYLVVLTSLATRLCARAGLDEATAIEMLAPLQRGALANLAERGLPDALTGPIARGDVSTVRAHLDALGPFEPAALHSYARLGELACELARAQGTPDALVAELRALLAAV
jgi:predicted short-subunit dehydrogenase-like oxidoreductase (DUF2520 family)